MKQFLLFLFLGWTTLTTAQNIRSYNGSNNNLINPTWGQAETNALRITNNGFGDTISSMGGIGRANPRTISNTLFEQNTDIPEPLGLSDFVWSFGQFLDHDITLFKNNPTEFCMIAVPAFDPHFDPMGTGAVMIPQHRTNYDPTTGTALGNPRMHINSITSFIDASNIYGSDSVRAAWLRTFSNGKLKTSAGDLLPFNTLTAEFSAPIDPSAPGMDIEGPPQPKHFVAGDVRANEQPTLTALHTIFVREHNRLCDSILLQNPSLTDEQIYQYSRSMVAGFIQKIAFEDWLPAMGINLDPYFGYQISSNPNINNVFAAAAFRLGHTMIGSEIKRLTNTGDTIPQGNIGLKAAFFNPMLLVNEGGIEPYFQGMATQVQQTIDLKVIDDLRNFLFGPPGAGGMDLAALNINRGRDRGLADYNTIRLNLGLTKKNSFNEITSDASIATKLQQLYGSVDSIDAWVGFLAEDNFPASPMGETLYKILKNQFEILRNADRFYFEIDPGLMPHSKVEIRRTTLQKIILRNSPITRLQNNVFFAIPFDSLPPILPVELMCFDAKKMNQNVQLTWLTASETNNYMFEIERSLNAKDFEKIGEKMGKNVPMSNYKFMDYEAENLNSQLIYYRLKQMDFDGKTSYSPIRKVRFETDYAGNDVLVYPNPFQDDFSILIQNASASENQIVLMDLQGKVIFSQANFQANSFQNISPNVPKGVYLLKVIFENEVQTLRLIKH